MIKKDGGVRHPIVDAPCPVLQYADDTLLICRAERQDVTRLKQILDDFANATGLQINFSKSTVVPMHVNDSLLPELVQMLQCRQESFP
jgi:hypothetical protein